MKLRNKLIFLNVLNAITGMSSNAKPCIDNKSFISIGMNILTQYCSATKISDKMYLTASHCIQKDLNKFYINKDLYFVDPRQTSDRSNKLTIKNYYVISNVTAGSHNTDYIESPDIAIVETNEEFPELEEVKITTNEYSEDEKLLVHGFGYEAYDYEDISFKTRPSYQCRQHEYFKVTDKTKIINSGAASSFNVNTFWDEKTNDFSLSGDSGSTLINSRNEISHVLIAGARGRMLAVDIYPYSDWINSIIKERKSIQLKCPEEGKKCEVVESSTFTCPKQYSRINRTCKSKFDYQNVPKREVTGWPLEVLEHFNIKTEDVDVKSDTLRQKAIFAMLASSKEIIWQVDNEDFGYKYGLV